MLKAYKLRIYPNAEQRVLLEKHFGCSRWVWNWALSHRVSVYEKEKKSVPLSELHASLPKLKAETATEWLAEVNAQSLQSSLRNLDMAYTRFFREKKGFPKFKSKYGRQSFQSPQRGSINFDSSTVSVPKVMGIKYRDSRRFEGQIKTVTISRVPSGKYFASLLVEDGVESPSPQKRIIESNVIGVDMGLTHFATLSTGEKVENPRFLRKSLSRLRRSQRKFSRRTKGSKNREKQRKIVARVHEQVSDQRKDFHHKLSTRLIRENQAVAVETLNVSGMKKNRSLARSISDAGWTQFFSMLQHKAEWNGKLLLAIGRFEPSSKLCVCGVINANLTLKDRAWTCFSCGETHDRDLLAAQNIKRMALHPSNFLRQGMTEFTPVEIGSSRSLKQECL
jgi:putative transposase